MPTIEVIPEALGDHKRQDIRKLCTHVFEGGHKCAACALRGEAFCYYHHPTRKPVHGPDYKARETRRARRTARQSFALPRPATHHDLQFALSEVLHRIAANQIDLRRAALLLNALQTVGRLLPPARRA
jgi:hypothetical protein